MARGNPQNFRPLTADERRKLSKKGGIASGKSRGKQKAIKELILAAEGADMEAVVQAMFKAAQKGDVSAAKFLADYSGQKPKTETEVTGAGGGALVVRWMSDHDSDSV